MTGKQLVAILRLELDDTQIPYLWSDVELLAYANEAEKEAVMRALLITDRTTSSDSGTAGICSIPISEGTGNYRLSSLVIQILRCDQIGTAGTYGPLGEYSRDEADELFYGWEQSTGAPEAFISEANNEFQIIPGISSVNGTARLVVNRFPLVDFTLDTEPEINIVYQRKMLNWAKKLAYLKNDSDTLNVSMSDICDKQFERDFGPPVNFKDLAMRRKLIRQGRMTPLTFGQL